MLFAFTFKQWFVIWKLILPIHKFSESSVVSVFFRHSSNSIVIKIIDSSLALS